MTPFFPTESLISLKPYQLLPESSLLVQNERKTPPNDLRTSRLSPFRTRRRRKGTSATSKCLLYTQRRPPKAILDLASRPTLSLFCSETEPPARVHHQHHQTDDDEREREKPTEKRETETETKGETKGQKRLFGEGLHVGDDRLFGKEKERRVSDMRWRRERKERERLDEQP